MLSFRVLQQHRLVWYGFRGLRATSKPLGVVSQLLLWLGLGAASSAFSMDFSPLKGGYTAGGEVRLQSQVRKLPSGSESQLRSTCLRASIRNSAPASQYSTDTEPVPMLVDFDTVGRSTGVLYLKSVRSVADPVSIVTLRSDCPLAVFEVSWTVFLTPPADMPGSKEPRWDMDAGFNNQLAADDTDLREFSLKNSSLLNQSRKPATQPPLPGMVSPETRSQMSRLKNELQKSNLGDVAAPEKTLTEKPLAQTLPSPKANGASVSTSVTAAAPTPVAPAPAPASVAASVAPSVAATAPAPAAGSVSEATGSGTFSEQTGLMAGENITASPPVQEVALAPSAAALPSTPPDDLDKLNKNLAGEVPGQFEEPAPNWLMIASAGMALALMFFGAFWSYQRFRLKTSAMPATFMRQASPPLRAAEEEPGLFERKAPADLFAEDSTPDAEHPQNNLFADADAVLMKTSKPSSRHPKLVSKDRQSEKSGIDEKSGQPEVKQGLVPENEADEDVGFTDSARLFESMLGADGHSDAIKLDDASTEDEPGLIHDARHREGLEMTLHGLERASVKPWKLPVAYASLIAARNRSLSSEVSSRVLRCQVGLLELAYQETRRGRLLDQTAVNELVATLMPAGSLESAENGVVRQQQGVPDILKSHLKTKRYELNGADAQSRFKANCLQLKVLCQVWPFCFAFPEWTQLVEDEDSQA